MQKRTALQAMAIFTQHKERRVGARLHQLHTNNGAKWSNACNLIGNGRGYFATSNTIRIENMARDEPAWAGLCYTLRQSAARGRECRLGM
jgi:hypothetical protein